MNALLLYSDAKEPVTELLLENLGLFDSRILPVSIERLLQDAVIFDEINDGSPILNWEFPDGLKITNSKDYYLVNRVLSVPDHLFIDFHKEDREYAQFEFRAYLMFAIEAFPIATSKPGPGGLSGGRHSLPQQWKIVEQLNCGISVPAFCLGLQNDNPFASSRDDIVYTTPYNYYDWRPDPAHNKRGKTSFSFMRPQGIPILACVVGNHVTIFPYRTEDFLPIRMKGLLDHHASLLAKTFDYHIAEILLFLDGDRITFGMISNIPYASKQKCTSFRQLVINEISNLLLQPF